MSQSNRPRPPAAHDHPRPGGNSSPPLSPTSHQQTHQPTPATTASKYPDTTFLQTSSPQIPPLAVLDERPLPRHIPTGLAQHPSRPLRGRIMSPKHTTSQRTTTNAPAQRQSTAMNSTRRSVAEYTARSNWPATMKRVILSPSRLSTGRPARD